jgi:tetratricopeptide (TPR) repeat protein
MTEEELATSKLFYPRIIDFSMALMSGEEFSSRLGMGTLGYSAPEAQDNNLLTHQSDLFSLGVIAYLLITGEHPFIDDNADPAEISAAVKEKDPRPICVTRENFPAELDQLVGSLMAKSHTLRPVNGFAVCETLESLGASYPFRRAIQPRHLLPHEQSGDVSTISVMPGFNLPARNELHKISDGDVRKLRLILDSNLRIGRLRWDNGVITSAPGFESYHWSERLRRTEYKHFSQLNLIEARWLVKCAVADGNANLMLIEDPPKQLRPAVVTPSLVEALRHKLSDRTFRTEGLRLAEKLQSSPRLDEALELCANLFVRAGAIERGAALTLRFCDALAKETREVEALPLLQRAAELAQSLGDKNNEIRLLHRDGDIRKELGDLVGAETRYKKLLQVAGNDPSRLLAETYKDLGDLYKLKQELKAGLDALECARTLYGQFEDVTELARVENNLGNLHMMNSDFKRALISYRKALKLHRKREHATNIASTVDNIASIYAMTGRIDRAVRIYKLCLKLKREVGKQGEIARTLNNLGYTYCLSGKIALALEALSEALEINRSLGTKKEALFNLDNLGICAITAGRFNDAIKYIREGRDVADELRDKPIQCSLDLSLAKTFTRTGLWRQAERLALRSEAGSYEFGDKTLTIRSLLQLAELRKRQANPKESAEFAKRALAVAREIDDRQGIVQAMLFIEDENLDNVHAALVMAEEINSPRDIAQAAITLAEACYRSGDSAKAAANLAKAEHYFENVEEDLDLPRYWKLCSILIMDDSGSDNAPAAERLTKAAEELQARQDKSDLWSIEILLGEACLSLGEFERAFTALNSAMLAIKDMMKEMPDSAGTKRFLAQPEIAKMAALIHSLRIKLNLT